MSFLMTLVRTHDSQMSLQIKIGYQRYKLTAFVFAPSCDSFFKINYCTEKVIRLSFI